MMAHDVQFLLQKKLQNSLQFRRDSPHNPRMATFSFTLQAIMELQKSVGALEASQNAWVMAMKE
jgi:hypothetical protein